MSTLYLLPDATASSFYTTKTLSTENAGFDLYVPADTVFAPGERKMVGMGVKAVVSDGTSLQNYWMLPRSSLSKTGLMLANSVGVIDKSYRGELIAALWNTTSDVVKVEKGQRLVQIVARDMSDMSECVVVDVLPISERGAGGFGSTGR
jgi:dUTP pyrophosphatase